MIHLPIPPYHKIRMNLSNCRCHSIPILSQEFLGEKFFKLALSSSAIAKAANPGNFVHARVSEDDYPLLRRAFSIHHVDRSKNRFEILFKVIGKGTEMLSKKRPGENLDVMGPIGNSFSLPRQNSEIVLVAGGMGIAPLWFLLSRLPKKLKTDKIVFFLGARSKRELVYIDRLKQAGVELIIATDDGSAGRKGLVTEIFLKEIEKRKTDPGKLAVYSCGPQMMLARMAQIAGKLDFSCQVSLENHMACGVGVCWGCVVKHKDGKYKRICADGPVFNGRELNFE
jgi:dihydroorotate dehydrogenase electron transfer subunit